MLSLCAQTDGQTDRRTMAKQYAPASKDLGHTKGGNSGNFHHLPKYFKKYSLTVLKGGHLQHLEFTYLTKLKKYIYH